jgi:acetolactate synthase-1/2/3 large subunit
LPADLQKARRWLSESHRPIMMVGLDVLKDDAVEAVRRFANAHSVPVITTYKAKGVIPEDHPLSLGGAGLSPLADKILLPLIAEADLVLSVGYDPIEMRTGWRNPWNPAEQRVIDIHAAPNHHYMHHATLSFLAHTGATLDALGEGGVVRGKWALGQVGDARAALSAAFPTDEPWGPAAVIDTCRAMLPEGTIATADSGAHRILLSQMWRCEAPRALLQSSGLCTMGCAVPLAMGAKLAAPDRPVVSFSGDAGFLMVAGELATAAELGQNTIFVVFVDRSLALIELKQRGRQMANRGVDFGNHEGGHDFAAIGRAFGGHGVTVDNRVALSGAIREALHADTFTVIAAVIDRKAYDARI